MHIRFVRHAGAAVIFAAVIGFGCTGLVPVATAQETTISFTSRLRIGSSGAQVIALQEILVQKGFLSVSPTGYFGQLTKQALEVLQATYGLEPVGSTGPLTRALLTRLSGSLAQTATSSSAPTTLVQIPAPASTTPSSSTLQLTADHTSIVAGSVVTLTWSSSGLYSCSAQGAWNGFLPPNGNVLQQPSQNSTYTITCTDGHTPYSQSVSVAVTSNTPAPTSTTTQNTTQQPAPMSMSGVTTTSNSVDVLSEGDSISVFWGGNHTGIYASTHPNVIFKGNAVGGSGLGDPQELSTRNDLYPRQATDLAVHAKVFTVLIGANNLNAVGSNWYEYSTPQAYADALFAYLAPFRAAGTKVAVATVLPQCTTGNPESGLDLITNTNRAKLNAIIRNAVGTKIDAVIDFAADPIMGPDAAACDTTLYQPGGLHPTDGAAGGIGGQGKLELVYAPVVDKLLTGAATPAATQTTGGTNTSTTISTSSSNNPITGQAAAVGAPDIATTDHNVNNDLTPMPVPASGVPDVVGAFRFICRHTNLAYDDPTVYPNQPGKSHLHDQTGVNGWNAYSNYANLRQSGGGSGCNDVAGNDQNPSEATWAANRTPYWQPALLDGKGNVIQIDFISVYYKRRPLTDPIVSDPNNPQYEGKAVPLPNGIKYIFGAFPGDPSKAADTRISFQCTGGASGVTYEGGDPANPITFTEAISCSKAHSDGSMNIRMNGPSCWDGVNLDSADHRSHLSYPSYGWWGYEKCDAAHPYVIPTYTYNAFYTILPTDTGDIHFSSDEMDNTKPRGWSFHVDYGPASWDPTVQAMWENNCIDKLLNCSAGNLGNGLGLKGAAHPIYYSNGTYTAAWRNPMRLVPVTTVPLAAAKSSGSMLAQAAGGMGAMGEAGMSHIAMNAKAPQQRSFVAQASASTAVQPQAYAAAAQALPAQPAGSYLSRFIHVLLGWFGF